MDKYKMIWRIFKKGMKTIKSQTTMDEKTSILWTMFTIIEKTLKEEN